MNGNKIRRRIFIETTVCVVFVILSIFYHHIDKYITGITFIALTLLLPITFVAMIVFIISGLSRIFRNRRNLTLVFCLPTIIVLTTLIYSLFSPWRLDSENFESKVVMRACYEGTQNQSYILFRVDKSFEINSTGVFFSDFWYLGKWRQHGDTIFMIFDKEKPKIISDTVIIYKNYLIPIKQLRQVDSLNLFHRYFYLGYCKGLN